MGLVLPRVHEIPRFVNYYGYSNGDRIRDSIEELITLPWDSKFEAMIPS